MDITIITAAVLLAVIAIIEIVYLFLVPGRDVSPLYAAVLPVFGEDEKLPGRLDCLALRSGGRTYVILVDYSATEEQLELCRQFCSDNPDSVLVTQEELEKILSKTFAIERKV